MSYVRNILVLYLLVIASGGPLPLVLHHLTCHQHVTEPGPVVDERQQTVCKHACMHHAPLKVARGVAAQWDASHDDECAVCYQLSQASVGTYFATADFFNLACSQPVVFVDLLDLTAVDCPYPPRGPPAV